MRSVNNFDRGCRNFSQCEQFRWCVQQKCSNLFQSFSFSQFFTYKFTACSQSCLVYSLVRVGTFSCLVHSLVRVGRFFLSKLPPWTILTSWGIFNYKGLDIKLLNIKLLNYIGLDFLYTARFWWNLSFPCFIFEKNPKNLQKPVEYTLSDGI